MKTAIITFGRFQGFHKGHKKLFNEMIKFSKLYPDSDIKIYISKTVNKNSPMAYSTKLRHFQAIFKQYAQYVHDHNNILVNILKELQLKYDKVFFVCGTDRSENLQLFFDKYNNKEFSFKVLKVVEIPRSSKKHSGTYIRSIVKSIKFYLAVPGSIFDVHAYRKDMHLAIECLSNNRKK